MIYHTKQNSKITYDDKEILHTKDIYIVCERKESHSTDKRTTTLIITITKTTCEATEGDTAGRNRMNSGLRVVIVGRCKYFYIS